MSDSMFWTPPDTVRALGTAIPREPADSDPNFVKHVYCEGARFHVLSWSTLGERCSEPRCIKNKRDLSDVAPNPVAASFNQKAPVSAILNETDSGEEKKENFQEKEAE